MTTREIQEQAETIEMTVSPENVNAQNEAIQTLASLVAALCVKIHDLQAEVNKINGSFNE